MERLPLIIGLTALALVPAAVTLQWQLAEHAAADAQRANTVDATQRAARDGASRVQSVLAHVAREVDAAAGNHALRVRDYWYQREVDAPLNVIAGLGARDHATINVIVDREGRVLAAHGADTVARHERWFERTPRASGATWWGDAAADAWQPTSLSAERSGGRARRIDAIALVRPVLDADGSTIGWWRHVRPIDSLVAGRAPTDDAVALIDARGIAVLRHGAGDLPDPTVWTDATPNDASAPSIVTVDSAGAPAEFACATVALDGATLAGGWRIAAGTPLAPLPTTADAALPVIAVLIGSGTVAGGMGWFVARGRRRRVSAVTRAIVAATATADAIDAADAGLDDTLVRALESWCALRVDAACRDLDAAAPQVPASSERAAETTAWHDALMSESDALEAASSTMTASLGALRTLVAAMQSDHAAHADDVDALRRQTDDLITQATATSTSSRDASALVESSNQQVTELASAASEIGAVISVIEEIAEQTNLLALNATIESARAGDAGRGFAVVATEVKALAKQTADATDDIRRRIEAIQASTGGALDAIERIAHAIEVVHDVAASISGAAEAQHSVTDAVATRLATTGASLERMHDATTRVEDAERDVIGVVDRLKGTAHADDRDGIAGTIGTRPDEENLAA